MDRQFPHVQTGQSNVLHRAPVVSVLIRTIGRASLANSIQSILTQVFKSWELIVVNASGKPLPPLPSELEQAVTRTIESASPLDRSTAANLLLDASTGQYAVFLDDDDWLLEGHLAKLVACLESNAALVAAYSDTQCVLQPGTPSQVASLLFEHEFDPVALQLQNYLPIHAVMFRLERVRTAPICRFEPAFELFEDWDFWLQMAAKGSFQRVPGVSAIYALNPKTGSGHAEADGVRRAAMLSLLGERQLRRWQPSDIVKLIEHEAKLANTIEHEKQVSKSAQTHAGELGIQLAESVQQAAQLALHASRQADRLGEQQHTIGEQQHTIGKQDHRIDEQAQQLAGLAKTFAQLQNYSRVQQSEIDKLGHIRVEHLKQIDEIYQSSSWRLTKPLRTSRQLMARVKSRAKRWFGRSVIRAVVGELMKNGLGGFMRRLPYYIKHRRNYLAKLRSPPKNSLENGFDSKPPVLRDMRLHPDLTGGGTTIDAKVSVIIPTLNAGREFGWLLRKLKAQQGVLGIEIVVVDSGSTDGTVDRAQDAGARVIAIRPEEFTHSYSRNLGADQASGDYLLFMVQDAYPIGDYWLYGMLRYLLDHADEELVAASCAEYSRSDSDMMYDSMINTHYKFLGCLEFDRIGEHCGDDHMALRSRGQLSDVSCLISRACFQQFRYRGNYAEDLDLGIRLIKSGKRVAMLAHVKVIHSHNRPAYYYLKRSFVDVVFLVGLFDDFTYPHCESLHGLLVGIESTAVCVSKWLQQIETNSSQCTLSVQVDLWISQARQDASETPQRFEASLGDQRLDLFLGGLTSRFSDVTGSKMSASSRSEALRFTDTFLARLEHFNQFAAEVYGPLDAVLRHELGDVVRKTFAAAAGSALAFYCLDHQPPDDAAHAVAMRIHQELAAGV